MTAFDAEFLHLEDSVNPLNIGVCAVFEGPALDETQVRRLVTAALPHLPRYRERLRRVPLDLARPGWEDDPQFDLDHHVFTSTLPEPGTDGQLQELVAGIMTTALDREHPLWELWVVDGLPDDRWALVAKSHHCLVDGVAGVELLTVLLDVDLDSPEHLAPPETPVGGWRLGLSAAGSLVRPLLAAPGWFAARALHPRRTASQLTTLASGAWSWLAVLRPTPATSVDGLVGPDRAWVWARADLVAAKAIREARGGTVNDAVLSAVTRGFRDLLLHRGEDPSEVEIRTVVPVSVREGAGDVANAVSAVVLDLPVGLVLPERRYAAVRCATRQLKASHEVEAGQAATALADWVPPPLLAAGSRALATALRHVPQRNISTVVTNVPGPKHPHYAVGRQLLATYPYVPVAFGVRITVGVLSYDGGLYFGVTGDRDTVPDLAVVARGIEAEIAELVPVSAG